MRSVLPALLLSLLFIACKKSDSPTDPAPPVQPITKDINLITTSAVPGEIVLAQANFEPSLDTVTISVAGSSTIAFKLDSNRVGFIMPVLPANTQAAIKYEKLGVAKTLSITVNNYSIITQPDVVYAAYEGEVSQLESMYASYETDTLVNLDPQFRQALKYMKDNLKQKYQSMTAEEKIQFAYGIRSNMLNDQNYLITRPDSSFMRTVGDPGDPEDNVRAVIFRLRVASITGGSRMLKGGALVATGIMLMTLPDPYSKTIGVMTAGLGVVLFLEGTAAYVNAHVDDQTMRSIFCVKELGIENERVQAAPVDLYKNVERDVSFKGKFRSIIQSDASSSASLLKDAFNARGNLFNAKTAVDKYYSKVNAFLLGTAPFMPVPAASFQSTPKSKFFTLQGAKLSLSNVSNPAITVTYSALPGALKIKASSTTITTQTPFTFDVTYTNSSTSTTVKDKINAVFIPEIYNYTLEIGDNYPLVSQISVVTTLTNGSSFSTPNYIRRMARMTLNGTPVSDWAPLLFGIYPTSASSISNPNYVVSLYDQVNNRTATVTLNLTLQNTGYAAIVGRTITVDAYLNNQKQGTTTITFHADGTLTKTGTVPGPGTYSFVYATSPTYDNCNTHVMKDDITAAIQTGSGTVYLPPGYVVTGGSSIRASSTYGCNNMNWTYVVY